MNPVPRQMPLMLDHRPALGRADLLVSASNSEAVRLLSGWRDWPRRHMALVGPARAGTTHLAHVWMQESGAELLPADRLDAAAAERLGRHRGAVLAAVAGLTPPPPTGTLTGQIQKGRPTPTAGKPILIYPFRMGGTGWSSGGPIGPPRSSRRSASWSAPRDYTVPPRLEPVTSSPMGGTGFEPVTSWV